MGFELQHIDQEKKRNDIAKAQDSHRQQTLITSSQTNAHLYTYYEDLIKQNTQKHPNANDKLALALILGRGFKPTVCKNRDLAFLDIDKMISFKHRSLGHGDSRIQNMKMAADLSGLKNNLLVRNNQQIPNHAQEQQNAQRGGGGNFQIFRLIRAARRHFIRNQAQSQDINDLDIVNTSQNRIQQQ